MSKRNPLKFVPGVLLGGLIAVAAMSGGCSDSLPGLPGGGNAACPEFNPGADFTANVDAKTKMFAQASSDLVKVSADLETDVKGACGAIAADLGETDTWTAKTGNDGINDACDKAKAKIDAIVGVGSSATLDVTVAIEGGQCRVNADAQLSCEASCQVDASCDPGKVDVRCEPGELSAKCDAECKGGATCEGSATVQADCKGTCEATCTGTCSGACTGTIEGGGCEGHCDGKCDGQATTGSASANCAGKCEGSCSKVKAGVTCTGKCEATCGGKCSGNCKLEANSNLKCGAEVSCKGGCTTTYKEPKCEAELTAPKCEMDASCKSSCSGRAQFKAECTPPSAKVVITGSSSASAEMVTKLQATLTTNLPKLWVAAKTKGKLAVDAADSVAKSGSAVVSGIADSTGKAFLCATVAAKASIEASASVSVSVKASASVSASGGAG